MLQGNYLFVLNVSFVLPFTVKVDKPKSSSAAESFSKQLPQACNYKGLLTLENITAKIVLKIYC